LDAGHADAANNLGNLLSGVGRFGEAIRALESAVRLRPRDASIRSNLGAARQGAGDFEGAVGDFQAALEFDPDYAGAWNNLGAALQKLERSEEAEAAFRRAIALQPTAADVCGNLATLHSEAGKIESALAWAKRATAYAPLKAGALAAEAEVLRNADRPEEALAAARMALAVDETRAESWNTQGLVLHDLGHLAEAAGSFARATRRRPDYVDAEVNRAMTLIALGDFPEAFKAYEARWRRPRSPPRDLGVPAWNGEVLPGATLFVQAEQGIGDNVSFLRFVAEAAGRVGRVAVEVPPEILRLAASLPGAATLIRRGDPPPACDRQIAVMSLPRVLGATAAGLSGAPYLRPHAALREAWGERLDAIAPPSRPRVGLVWAGNPKQGNDRRRSIPIAALAPLGDVPDIAWFSLQKGRSEKLPFPHFELGEALADFADTAAAMRALDLMISVDTSTAHVAGAVGAPTLVALAHAPDWRYGPRGETTRWYASLELFRQSRPGDWSEPIARIAGRLAALAARRRAGMSRRVA
ncbi:MAG: tetratricopeptide repeat protein, partial [Alphaproteobacteria bacterium]|nr:tetratricopeptide repeat protein [Alphaproteobacteria bacterium]